MKFIKGLFAVVILVVIMIGAGLYLLSTPKKVIDVTWSEVDFQSYCEKGGIVFDDNHASVEDIFAGNFRTSGRVKVDDVITNSELTAIANKSMNGNSIMKDVRIKCTGDDQIEMSCVTGDLTPLINNFPQLKSYEKLLKQAENKPIFMKSTLYYDSNTKRFEGTTKEMYVGKIKIPTDSANKQLRDGGDLINNMIKDMEGFTVKNFKVTSDGFDFDGTIPKEIETLGAFGK